MKAKPKGWKNESKRHRDAYYKGKQAEYFVVRGFMFEDINWEKKDKKGMVDYAVQQLKFNHEQGRDRETSVSDFRREPMNAWIYLKDKGLAVQTNKRRW